MSDEDLREYRRRRRNAKTYRYQKKRRRSVKAELVAAFGGRCLVCGYATSTAALDFHHRDPGAKEFSLREFNGSLAKAKIEADKCDLLCANCHRMKHAIEDAAIVDPHPVVVFRRALKARAVDAMGGRCGHCGFIGPAAVFEFHHLDAATKDFGISQDGIPRRWETVAAELAKCVMLCANCHREVHAGVRTIEPPQPSVQEEALEYAA